MKAQRLTWYKDLEVDATGECPEIRHLILEPTWNDVVQAVHRLDGKRYTFVTLSTQKNYSPPERFTMLNIAGDGSLYAASLEFYSE